MESRRERGLKRFDTGDGGGGTCGGGGSGSRQLQTQWKNCEEVEHVTRYTYLTFKSSSREDLEC